MAFTMSPTVYLYKAVSLNRALVDGKSDTRVQNLPLNRYVFVPLDVVKVSIRHYFIVTLLGPRVCLFVRDDYLGDPLGRSHANVPWNQKS